MSEDYTIKFSNATKDPFSIRPFTSNGPLTPSTVVLDTTAISANTSVVLLGKGMDNYGNRIMNNFVYLLENFAAPTPPSYPIQGQLWYDSTSKIMKVYDSGWSNLANEGGAAVANLNMSGYRITNVGSAVTGTDALNIDGANARYLKVTGGTLSGPLSLSTAPTDDSHAVTKAYVDSLNQGVVGDTYTRGAADSRFVNVTGDAMLAPLTLNYTPVLDVHATTKLYVDDADDLKLDKAGGTLTGTLTTSVVCDGSAQVMMVNDGDTVTIGNLVGTIVLIGSPVLDLTVELPTAPLDKQKVTVSFAVDVTNLTLVGLVVGDMTSVAVGDFATWMFDSGTLTWYRVG